MIPFFHQIHLLNCSKTIEVQDYKLNSKTRRFEPFRNSHVELLKVERYDPALSGRDDYYENSEEFKNAHYKDY